MKKPDNPMGGLGKLFKGKKVRLGSLRPPWLQAARSMAC